MLYIIPWRKNKQVASCRLRVFSILPLLDLDYSFTLPKQYHKDDILFIQKVTNLKELKRAKSFGIKVVFDIDDMYLNKPLYKEMIESADIITVATEEMKSRFLPNSVVIPNCLDWSGFKKKEGSQKNLLSWTSYGNNARFLNVAYDKLNRQGYKILAITSPDYKNYFSKQVEYVEWSLDTIDQNLSKAEAGLICLPNNDFCVVKSMHKLLKYWAIGMPCYATLMPDYVKAVNESGASQNCLVSDWDNLKDIEWSESLREYALQYTPVNIAPLWKKVFT